MNDKTELKAYIDECNAKNRVCPKPMKWNDLYKFIKIKTKKDDVEKPLILTGWYETPLLAKIACFQQQLEYAYDNGIFESVKNYLSKLTEEQWHHIND